MRNLYSSLGLIWGQGQILSPERTETMHLDTTIKGLKEEALPYLIPQETTTLFIHPKWAYQDVDGLLGDMLLIIDIVLD